MSIARTYVTLLCNHSAGHIGDMGGFRMETSHKSTNATQNKDDVERYKNTLLEREREREREISSDGVKSQEVNIVVGLVSTTKGWDIDCQ